MLPKKGNRCSRRLQNSDVRPECETVSIFPSRLASAEGFTPKRCSQNCSCPKPPDSKPLNKFQQARRMCLKTKYQKTGSFGEWPESALGAGGRAFKSPRPDQRKQAFYLQCRASARKTPVASCGALGFLEA